jgi:transcriptional regulator of arginine metabolism
VKQYSTLYSLGKTMSNNSESDLLNSLKSLLQEQRFATQKELICELSLIGVERVSPTKLSRSLTKLGAIKIRSKKYKFVYCLPEKQNIPHSRQTIDSMVLDIKHNGIQIIIKTVIGAAVLISKIIEKLGETSGVLGCMASDNIVLVIPTNVLLIEDIMTLVSNQLGENGIRQ